MNGPSPLLPPVTSARLFFREKGSSITLGTISKVDWDRIVALGVFMKAGKGFLLGAVLSGTFLQLGYTSVRPLIMSHYVYKGIGKQK